MEKKKQGCLKPVLIVLILFAGGLIFGISQIVQNPEKYQAKTVLAETMELNREQETAMVDIFTQCGIGEITSAKQFQAGNDHTSYWLDDEETKAYKDSIVVWVTNETKTVETIYFGDHDIYIDGQPVAPVTDFYVNSEDRGKYRVSSQILVNQILNYPDSAEYPSISGWKFGVDEGVVIVQSTVQAENAFGAKSKSSFQVKWKNGNPVSMIVDGQEYISNNQ